MAIYEKRGTDLHQPARPPGPPAVPTPQAVQTVIEQWLSQPARCAQPQCAQPAQRLQAWGSATMLVLVTWCPQHLPPEQR